MLVPLDAVEVAPPTDEALPTEDDPADDVAGVLVLVTPVVEDAPEVVAADDEDARLVLLPADTDDVATAEDDVAAAEDDEPAGTDDERAALDELATPPLEAPPSAGLLGSSPVVLVQDVPRRSSRRLARAGLCMLTA